MRGFVVEIPQRFHVYLDLRSRHLAGNVCADSFLVRCRYEGVSLALPAALLTLERGNSVLRGLLRTPYSLHGSHRGTFALQPDPNGREERERRGEGLSTISSGAA